MCILKNCLVVGAVYPLIILLVSGNYPLYRFYKPCARLKNTVNYQKPICMDNGSGGFDAESETNCKESFKATCPEFNMASCEWLTNISFPNKSVAQTPIPCCRLKYFARRYTWMEIYYTLQYGKDVPVYDIVEIRRKIKKHESFSNRDQNDWPESVSDPNGERGLTWIVATNLTKPLNVSGRSAADLCAAENDTRCSVDIVDYFSANFPTGFDYRFVPKTSNSERAQSANVSYTLSGACRDIWVDAHRARACQVLYWYNSRYLRNNISFRRNLQFEFLEVQAYHAPWKSANLTVRYAYWSQAEGIETREEIFNAYDHENDTSSD